MVAGLQAECRVMLENSSLQHNTAINGGAFFAASTPCFMVSPCIRLSCKLLGRHGWVGRGMLKWGHLWGLCKVAIVLHSLCPSVHCHPTVDCPCRLLLSQVWHPEVLCHACMSHCSRRLDPMWASKNGDLNYDLSFRNFINKMYALPGTEAVLNCQGHT